MPSYTPAGNSTSSSNAFPGSGATAADAMLGITQAEGDSNVVITASTGPGDVTGAYQGGYSARTGGAGHGGQTQSVRDALNQFNSLQPSEMSSIGEELLNAGLMADAVYNSGQMSDSDIYNAYKKAILGAAQSGQPVSEYINSKVAEFNASGGPKVKLPNVRYTAPLTSLADISVAADAEAQKLLGRRATPLEKKLIQNVVNSAELSGKQAEAGSAYQQMLAYRGLSADGSPAGQTPVDTSVSGANGQKATVTSGPIVTAYNAAPSPDAAAYNYNMQTNPDEVTGRTVAAGMQAIAQFVGQK